MDPACETGVPLRSKGSQRKRGHNIRHEMLSIDIGIIHVCDAGANRKASSARQFNLVHGEPAGRREPGDQGRLPREPERQLIHAKIRAFRTQNAMQVHKISSSKARHAAVVLKAAVTYV